MEEELIKDGYSKRSLGLHASDDYPELKNC